VWWTVWSMEALVIRPPFTHVLGTTSSSNLRDVNG
jgi:hypothetical protein